MRLICFNISAAAMNDFKIRDSILKVKIWFQKEEIKIMLNLLQGIKRSKSLVIKLLPTDGKNDEKYVVKSVRENYLFAILFRINSNFPK